MIVNANYDINGIENGLWGLMKSANVCPVIYPNRRPSFSNEPNSSFIVVKAVTEVVDKTAFGKNICRVEVYTKGVGGFKDSKTASDICQKVMNALPAEDGNYRFTYLSNIPIGLDATGYDVEAININVLIK